MADWRVQLLGDMTDLQLACNAFSNPDPRIVRENDEFFLKANEFEAITDAGNVRNRAIEIAQSLSHALHLWSPDIRAITTGHVVSIDDNGQQRHYIFAEGNIRMRGVVSGGLSGGTITPPRPHAAIRNFDAEKKHTNVADALRFFSHDDWVNLYKAYEVMRDDLGGRGENYQ